VDFHNTELQHSYRAGFHAQHLETGLDDEGRIEPITEFDHGEIDRRLGWQEPKPPAEVRRDRRFEDAAELLSELLRFFAESGSAAAAGLRAFALVAAVRPDLLPARARSLSRLAGSLGVTRAALSKYVAKIYRIGHGIFSKQAICRPASVRDAARRSALAYHARRQQALQARKRRRGRGVSPMRAGRKNAL